MSNKVSVFIADRSCIIREGLHSLLEKMEHVEIAGKTGNLFELKQQLDRVSWDLLLIGSNLEKDEDSICSMLEPARCQASVVLVLSGPQNIDTMRFRDVIRLDQDKQEVLHKLSDLTASFPPEEEIQVSHELTERERKVVELVARGMTNREIAKKLFISLHTVITHRKNISHKLGIRSIPGLTVYAILNDIISIDELK